MSGFMGGFSRKTLSQEQIRSTGSAFVEERSVKVRTQGGVRMGARRGAQGGARNGTRVERAPAAHSADPRGEAVEQKDFEQEVFEQDALARIASGQGIGLAVRQAARPGAGIREMSELLEKVTSIAAGTGPELARVLVDPLTSDVLVNSTQAWVDRGRGLEPLDLPLDSDEQTRALAVRMAAACGRRLDDASPIVDGSLPGGIRLHAVLPAPSASGTLLSLRTARAAGMGVDDMIETDRSPPKSGEYCATSSNSGRMSWYQGRREAGRRHCSQPCSAWFQPTSESSALRRSQSSPPITRMSFPSSNGKRMCKDEEESPCRNSCAPRCV